MDACVCVFVGGGGLLGGHGSSLATTNSEKLGEMQ